MNQQTVVMRALQDQVRTAVLEKVPQDFHEDARSLFPDLGKVIQSAVAHYNPPTPEALIEHLRGNQTPAVKLLVELLTEKNPLFFMAEVERKLVDRRKAMTQHRLNRRKEIEQAFERAVKRIVETMQNVKSSETSVILLDHLVKTTTVAEIDSLRPLMHQPFWENITNRETLKAEINHHIYYFVVRILDGLKSYDHPENFKVRPKDVHLIQMALQFTLREVLAPVPDRVKAGKFIVRKNHFANRGDRMADREIFLSRRPRKGLGALIDEFKTPTAPRA